MGDSHVKGRSVGRPPNVMFRVFFKFFDVLQFTFPVPETKKQDHIETDPGAPLLVQIDGVHPTFPPALKWDSPHLCVRRVPFARHTESKFPKDVN